MIKLSGRTCIMEIPAFTKVGEEFNLSGNDFTENAIGRIDQIIGQGGGKTRVRMSLVEGSILYVNSDDESRMVEMSRNTQNPRRGGSRKVERMGGEPLPVTDLKPRTGRNNATVNNSAQGLLESIAGSIDESEGTPRSISLEEHAQTMGIDLGEIPKSEHAGGRKSKLAVPRADRVLEAQQMEENAPKVLLRRNAGALDDLDGDAWGDEEQ